MHASTVFPLLLSLVSSVTAACTREQLLSSASKFVAAVQAGTVSSSLPLTTTNFTYQENNKPSTLTHSGGPFSQPLKIDLSRSTADTQACATYTLIISSSGSKPYVLATQLRFSSSNTSEITLIDTISATTGSLFFNAKKTLEYIQKQSWAEITPEGGRPSRELLKKVGDAYLDMWTDANAAGTIPWGTDCERVEGSQYTRPCGTNVPKGGSKTNNGNRRYVIDEVVGSVDVLCSFDALQGSRYPDSHEIRVEGGKVKYVHTVTV
ncbi:hypothetical protein QBC38DRAFT_479736 [Podospora fimiseda]|uniref:DUF8021 domain-containing protein n=1 Tax=Podospora fimiseda TaxID=252190 RepID=A0AAN7BN94_9PEZI|nr:hypothetical protein QBC38DRAFT_479736 [Podospora fimiseda]